VLVLASWFVVIVFVLTVVCTLATAWLKPFKRTGGDDLRRADDAQQDPTFNQAEAEMRRRY